MKLFLSAVKLNRADRSTQSECRAAGPIAVVFGRPTLPRGVNAEVYLSKLTCRNCRISCSFCCSQDIRSISARFKMLSFSFRSSWTFLCSTLTLKNRSYLFDASNKRTLNQTDHRDQATCARFAEVQKFPHAALFAPDPK